MVAWELGVRSAQHLVVTAAATASNGSNHGFTAITDPARERQGGAREPPGAWACGHSLRGSSAEIEFQARYGCRREAVHERRAAAADFLSDGFERVRAFEVVVPMNIFRCEHR